MKRKSGSRPTSKRKESLACSNLLAEQQAASSVVVPIASKRPCQAQNQEPRRTEVLETAADSASTSSDSEPSEEPYVPQVRMKAVGKAARVRSQRPSLLPCLMLSRSHASSVFRVSRSLPLSLPLPLAGCLSFPLSLSPSLSSPSHPLSLSVFFCLLLSAGGTAHKHQHWVRRRAVSHGQALAQDVIVPAPTRG